MDINRANLNMLFQDFRVAFTNGLNAGMERRVLQNLAMIVPSTSASTIHAWLNQIPGLREWVGDRVVKNIESNSLEIKNRKFEGTLDIKREDIEDDIHGLYRPLARLMGERAAVHPDELLVEALVANGNWADGNPFFGGTRTYGTNTIDNHTNNALSETEFDTAVENMQSFVGHNDEPLNVTPTTLLVGPSNRGTAFDIVQNEFRGSAAANGVQIKNKNKDLVDVQISSRLVGANAGRWFLLGEIAGIRGLVWQERIAPEFQDARATDDSDFVFENDVYQIGVRHRGEAFLGLPHLIYGGFA